MRLNSNRREKTTTTKGTPSMCQKQTSINPTLSTRNKGWKWNKSIITSSFALLTNKTGHSEGKSPSQSIKMGLIPTCPQSSLNTSLGLPSQNSKPIPTIRTIPPEVALAISRKERPKKNAQFLGCQTVNKIKYSLVVKI